VQQQFGRRAKAVWSAASSTGTRARAAAPGPACTTLIADDRLFSSSGSGSDGEKAKGENETVWRSCGRLRQAEASVVALSAMCIAQASCVQRQRDSTFTTTSPRARREVPSRRAVLVPACNRGKGGGDVISYRQVRDRERRRTQSKQAEQRTSTPTLSFTQTSNFGV
jgi:hypothetical protein